ncbi:hypothetical protein NJBCHELONAE_06700 [Mycobacteroides chelonae]|nr:hypothetical protein NJBCHELONAE_06700 [Mycobacteroides chelonae]
MCLIGVIGRYGQHRVAATVQQFRQAGEQAEHGLPAGYGQGAQ